MNDIVPAVLKAECKSYISGRMQQNIVTFGAENSQGRENAAQDAVFIADPFSSEVMNSVPDLVPLYDLFVILFSYVKISISRVRRSPDHRLRYGGTGRKIHISDPHRDYIETLIGGGRRKGGITLSERIYCDRIHSASVHDRCKIIFHSLFPPQYPSSSESMIIVKGPLFVRRTFMSAPNSPVCGLFPVSFSHFSIR